MQLQHQQLQVQQEQQVDAETAEEAVPAEPPTPTADDIREELLPLLQDALQQLQRGQDNGNAGHSLVAITMLCVLPGYEARATDFLQSLFAELPGKVRETSVILQGHHMSCSTWVVQCVRHVVGQPSTLERLRMLTAFRRCLCAKPLTRGSHHLACLCCSHMNL